MFNIVICEEDANIRNLISSHVRQYFFSMKASGKVALSTGEPQKVLEYINHSSNQENIYIWNFL